MGNFGHRANFQLPVFGGFARFGAWRIKKRKNTKIAWGPAVR